MTWADFYLFCFLFGFFFSLVAVVTGHLHLDFHSHGHEGMTHAAHGHLSRFNMGTGAAFLAWFGGTGYLAAKFYGVWFVTSLALAVGSGVIGAGIVFWFLSKVLMREREEMDPILYDMIGVLGTASCTIRPEGVGEILYSRDGARRCASARSDDGSAIPNGAEVVVTRYEDGIAYVRRWDDMAGT
jgi:membrane protein implicated in regulation of membrane protease activity